jgi:probable rRNA maturation factor
MSQHEVEVQVDKVFANAVPSELLARLAQGVLAAEGQPDGAGLTIVIVDDAQIQALNRDYREIDAPTDVLSFAAHEGEPSVLPDEAALYLGDVVISFPTASAQAQEAGHTVNDELTLLTVHGCLHLLGYDHAEEADAARMWARQAQLLAQ